MARLNTLRVRFAVWTAGLLLVLLAAFGAFVYVALERGLAREIDQSMQLTAGQVVASIDVENGQVRFSSGEPDIESEPLLRQRAVTIRILDRQGQPLTAFGPYQAWAVAPESLAAALNQQSQFVTLTDPATAEAVRFYTLPILNNDQVIAVLQVAQSLAPLQATLNRLLVALLAGGALAVAVAAVGGYALAAQALRPIDHITHTARHISTDDLSARLGLPETPDEVGRLAATFDHMLARLERGFQRERQFTADASHELRTPLAAMQTILSVIRAQRRAPDDYEQALSDLAEEADRLQSLVEDLLALARRDGPAPAVLASVDLSALLGDVCDSLRPLAEAKGLTLSNALPAGLALLGDGDQLIRLFVNLLDNALKYTAQGGVSVQANATAAHVTVVVADTGPGIAPEHLPHIFDRFYRADAARTAGSARPVHRAHSAGLGLAIALEIARAHHGRLTAASVLGQGSRFEVVLPVTPPAISS